MNDGNMAMVRGSQWRKWDLHVHVPGTKLSNGYTRNEAGKHDLDRFCEVLEASDVSAFGLTDYFNVDTFFKVRKRYGELYPNSGKLLLLNLELRLNETVNNEVELVDYHLIFDPRIERTQIDKFLYELKTETTLENGLPLRCSEVSGSGFESVTVSRRSIREAIQVVFGTLDERNRAVVAIVPVNGNGIRTHGATRKAQLSDEIDKAADGFFGNLTSVAHFLIEGRYEDPEQLSAPKPVFAGSDAHSFGDLDDWLGREVRGDNEKNVTWIKSDLTWDGFLQAFYEPSERVRMQADLPDRKDAFKWISHVTFPESSSFPPVVYLNPNLNSIIGSRSSGKSALLAHIAHAIAPEYVEKRQALGAGAGATGPAAGITWGAAKADTPVVHWADGKSEVGKVVYVPQNSLWSMSERPDEITAQITPALEIHAPDAVFELDKLAESRERVTGAIEAAVKQWWTHADERRDLRARVADAGEATGIEAELKTVDEEIAARGGADFDADLLITAVEAEQALANLRVARATAERQIKVAEEILSSQELMAAFDVQIDLSKTGVADSQVLSEVARRWLPEARSLLASGLRSFLSDVSASARLESSRLAERIVDVSLANSAALAEKTKAEGLSPLLARRSSYLVKLSEREALDVKLQEVDVKLAESLSVVESSYRSYKDDLQRSRDWFSSERPEVEGIRVSIEADQDPLLLEALAASFNKVSETAWVDRALQGVKISSIRNSAGNFLEDMYAGRQKLTLGADARSTAAAALQLVETTRVTATLDDDTIGGFNPSTMTPGKQALFALRLMLSATDDFWPLLLDQPEDDLDSRAIYDTIVTDLRARKRERQIIVVTHDANVVVGADSEAVIVANRHGADRPNEDGRFFNYRTGSLEHSETVDGAIDTLQSKGTLEHACSILDGGTQAFRKRWLRYRV